MSADEPTASSKEYFVSHVLWAKGFGAREWHLGACEFALYAMDGV